MYSLPLNFDCLSLIAEYIDVPDVVTTCMIIAEKDDVRRLIKNRLSPLNLFSRLVSDPLDLLYCMSVNRCVLSGSRVANYFFRGSCSNDSDWDFFIEDSIQRDSAVFGGMRSSLSRMGVVWKEKKGSKSSMYESLGLQVLGGTMQKGKGKGQQVHLVTSMNSPVLDRILSFHSTPVQCLITHYGAVHLYGKLSQSKKQLVWHGSIAKTKRHIEDVNASICDFHTARRHISYTSESLELVKSMVDCMWSIKDDYLLLTDTQSISTDIQRHWFKENALEVIRNLDITQLQCDTMVRCIANLVTIVTRECECIQDTAYSAVDKYVERGYEIMLFRDYFLDFVRYNPSADDYNSDSDPTRRHIGDYSTIVIPFKGMGLEISDIRIDERIQYLSTCEWIENPRELKMRYNSIPYTDLAEMTITSDDE